MTPGARTPTAPTDSRDVVLDVLARVATEGAHASVALDRALASLARPEDRSFATDVVYGTLRWAPAIDAALSGRLRDPDALPARVRAALRAGTYERGVRGTPAHAAVHAWVEAIKRGRGPEAALAGLVNAVLRRVDLDEAERRGGAAAAVALPEPLWHHLRGALGAEGAAASARAMLAPSPLWLTALGEGAVAALEAEGAEVRPGPLPTSIAVRPRRPLAELSAFRDGLVQPQNPSSAAIVGALGEVRGRTVLDVGSGHGVKAAQLVAAGAQVIAVEIDPRRSEAGRRNLARLGFEAHHVVADATAPLDGVPTVDAALLDAPCTGTGTLRGHPEIKQRWNVGDVRVAAARQGLLLRRVAERVRPGGRLVYAVCALGREEGEDVVTGFLAGAPEWRAVEVDLALPTLPASVGARILPSVEGLDGFYVAVLDRDAILDRAAPAAGVDAGAQA